MSWTEEALLILYGAADDQVLPEGKHWLFAFVLLEVLNFFHGVFAGLMFAVTVRQRLASSVVPCLSLLIPQLN